ncbi:hypothetical protein LEP48_05860 [Isoptericola sp. NEAU-Y5]|uniref:Uncharacterized protein n=1 Tax=Isoptericola luteus TaxID=2879484 RepID=A0ABS7ZGE0_9MICO|nr:hypothetical protein [Isoptericola sp. NEAU-Y5]MCA5892880.1 hypothetical protein [Isoptericola sp. NEAU-Y5]
MTAEPRDGRTIEYSARIPDVEAAVALKAHSWRGRYFENDLADLHSLLEIRDAHPDTSWRLEEQNLAGFRKDAAQILHELAKGIVRKNFRAPGNLDRRRMAALITRHVSRPWRVSPRDPTPGSR